MLHKGTTSCLCEAINQGEKPCLGDSILIRSPNWLGDVVMTLPAVAQLIKHTKESAKISILAPEKLHGIWKLLPEIKEILPVKSCPFDTAKIIRKGQFSSAILFPNSFRSALEILLARVPARVGYAGHWRRFLLTHVFEKAKTKSFYHQKHDYLNLMKEIGIPISNDAELPLITQPPHHLKFQNYLVVCPGAEYGPAKRWPAERFAQAAQEIAQKRQLEIILLGAKVDQPQSAEVEKNLNQKAINLTGKTSLDEFIAYLAHAKLVLCNDSGAMHLSALLQTPAIAIFGSTEPALTGPLSESVKILRTKTSCSPCFLRECPTYFECMQKISVEDVVHASNNIL